MQQRRSLNRKKAFMKGFCITEHERTERSWIAFYPKGIPQQSPGLRGTSYPGYPRARGLNSEGVAPLKPITPCHNLSLRFIFILSSQPKSAGHSYAMRPL